jgi:hypothetical protein
MAVNLYPQFTLAELDEIVRQSAEYTHGGLDKMRPPWYEKLTGKQLTLRFNDGRVLYYSFSDKHTLTWKSDDAGEPKEEYYDAHEVDDGIIFFVHIIKGTSPQKANMIVIDTGAKLVTAFFAQIGNEVSTREVDRDIVFGYVDDGGTPPANRHSLTRDLVGRSIVWTYSPEFCIQHIYASQWYSCFVDFSTFYGGALLSSPCNYVKINDHVYIYSWVETEGAGVQGFALMNLFDMHDVGCFFGINGGSKFECYTFGATGEYVGQLANLHIPNDMNKEYSWPPFIKEGGEQT